MIHVFGKYTIKSSDYQGDFLRSLARMLIIRQGKIEDKFPMRVGNLSLTYRQLIVNLHWGHHCMYTEIQEDD